ncbi:MAG: GNAT family N-acetyltransferase [Chloroflexota bacterium]
MAVVAHPQSNSKDGPRPININKDIPQILRLLELCFGSAIHGDGRHILTSDSLNQSPAFLWRMTPAAGKLAQGIVWEVNGRIVGNVTLLTTKVPGRFLIVNVAVHPDFRRQNIAKNMMVAVTQQVKKQKGREILLQVVKSNTAANMLYQSLNYDRLGSITSWYTNLSRIRRIGVEPHMPEIRELRSKEWREAYRLDTSVLSPQLSWPEPPDPNMYKFGIFDKLANFLNGRQIETWVTRDNSQNLTGLGSIVSEWGRLHHAALRVHPDYQGQLERPLLAKLVRRLHYLPRRNIRLDHPDDDEIVNRLLKEANFQPQRTLTHMKLEL